MTELARGAPPDRSGSESNLATDPRELWFAGLRVLSDGQRTEDWDCQAVVADEMSGRKNTREQAAEDWGTSRRLTSIRQPPFAEPSTRRRITRR